MHADSITAVSNDLADDLMQLLRNLCGVVCMECCRLPYGLQRACRLSCNSHAVLMHELTVYVLMHADQQTAVVIVCTKCFKPYLMHELTVYVLTASSSR